MNLYNKNTEILKAFFKKPLTLVISILFFVSAVISCIYIIVQSLISGEFFGLAICVYPMLMVLPAVAFLNLFIQGRKTTEISRLNTPLILIYMYTILSIFEPLSFFTYYMLSYFTEKNEFSFVFAGLFILIFIVPAIILLTFQFISMIITFHSIRKSANGIYLSKKGSVFMGVTSILSAAAVAVIAVDLINATEYSRVLNHDNIFNSVILILGAVVLFALFICLGIWALMYSSAILNASVCLYGTSIKSNVKVQTLNDTQYTPQNNNVYISEQTANGFSSETQFANSDVYEQPDIFSLPKQNEPNPYSQKSDFRRKDENIETTEDNHINFNNPYKNFVPQNPFIDNNTDK